jgi:superfamily II RNA helicase
MSIRRRYVLLVEPVSGCVGSSSEYPLVNDTDEIQAEIDQLVQERESLKQEPVEIDDLKSDLPELEREQTRLQNQIEEKKQKLEAVEGTVKEAREEKHDVPFILLDSLEAIDSGRIAALVEYLTAYDGYLLVRCCPRTPPRSLTSTIASLTFNSLPTVSVRIAIDNPVYGLQT